MISEKKKTFLIDILNDISLKIYSICYFDKKPFINQFQIINKRHYY